MRLCRPPRKALLGIGIAAPPGPPVQEVHGDTFDMRIWLIEAWTGSPVSLD